MDETARLAAEAWADIPAELRRSAQEGVLFPNEIFWRDHYQYLKDHGYTLRRRYEVDWSASWNTNGLDKYDCEDSRSQRVSVELGLYYVRDGSYVVLKRLDATSPSARDELMMARFISSPDLSMNPRNRCVPLLDVIPPMEGSSDAFMVMPLLFDIDMTPFETIGEAVEFFRQIFEGLQFMHNHNFAHGHPPHPVNNHMRRDYAGFRPSPSSRTVTPIKYYFIDFDLSEVFGPNDVRLRRPPWGGDSTVPEHNIPHDPPCDPFPVDVYCLANVIRRWYLDGVEALEIKPKHGFEFMRELVSDM
ncbi:hypothetical protein H0H93_014264, partial [Arthromyces matolae]